MGTSYYLACVSKRKALLVSSTLGQDLLGSSFSPEESLAAVRRRVVAESVPYGVSRSTASVWSRKVWSFVQSAGCPCLVCSEYDRVFGGPDLLQVLTPGYEGPEWGDGWEFHDLEGYPDPGEPSTSGRCKAVVVRGVKCPECGSQVLRVSDVSSGAEWWHCVKPSCPKREVPGSSGPGEEPSWLA